MSRNQVPSAKGPHPGALGSTGRRVFAGLLVLILATPLKAETSGDFLLFPALAWRSTSGSDAPHYPPEDRWVPSLNLFATADMERFRFLGEWFLTEDSQEFQRLQLGWRWSEDDTLWLGRFHTPIGYWNSAYHHGTYLQTSISRPGIVEFEGGHGPLPTHLAGLLAEGSTEVGDGAVHYSLGVGAGPLLNSKLNPFDVASRDDHRRSHNGGTVVNVNWRPVAHSRDMFGLFAARTTIGDSTDEFDRTQQTLYGIYTNWHWGKLRLLGAWFQVSNTFKGIAAPRERFASAYLQAEYALAARTTAFSRFETTANARADSLYLGRFESFVTQRLMGGIRYELSHRQALTAEISAQESFGVRTDRITLQWSAYFP